MRFSLASALTFGVVSAVIVSAPLTSVAQPINTSQSLNYIGLGGSNDGVAAISKFALNENLSLRPTAIGDFDDLDGTFFMPLTYDFQAMGGKLQPYLGAGIGGTTEDEGSVGGVLTAGVDYSITPRIVANGSVNYDIFGNNEVQGILGLGVSWQN